MATPAHAPTTKSGAETPQRVSGMARASYRSFDDALPLWLRLDVCERTRCAVCTRKVNESFQHAAHSRRSNNRTTMYSPQEKADRPNSSSTSSSTQQRWRRGSGGSQLRASEPPIVRLMSPFLGVRALLGSVTCVLCYLVMYV